MFIEYERAEETAGIPKSLEMQHRHLQIATAEF